MASPVPAPAQQAPPSQDEAIRKRAKSIAHSCDYDISEIVKVLEPISGDEWEVLFIGRYRGNSQAGIKGDVRDAKLPYRVWVDTETGGGYVTESW